MFQPPIVRQLLKYVKEMETNVSPATYCKNFSLSIMVYDVELFPSVLSMYDQHFLKLKLGFKLRTNLNPTTIVNARAQDICFVQL